MSKKAVIVVAITIFVVTLLAVVVPAFISSSRVSSTRSYAPCINNLRRIDGAKQEWMVNNAKTTNDVPKWDDIRVYLSLGTNGQILTCPDGGTYTLGRVGEPPRCSFGGLYHTLP
jgi:hypothetical protein